MRKYLEFCWSLPYYGSAFFRGQIETPAKSLTSLVINQDTEVIIAINSLGLHVIDPTNVVKDTTITGKGDPFQSFWTSSIDLQ